MRVKPALSGTLVVKFVLRRKAFPFPYMYVFYGAGFSFLNAHYI